MSRYIAPLPADLTDRQLALYESIADGPRKQQASLVPVTDADGRLLGPFALMTIAPDIGDAVQSVGAALRFAGALPARTRELAILTVAVHRGSDFEWFAHVGAARDAGLTDKQLRTLQQGGVPEDLNTQEAAVHRVALLLLADGHLSATSYADAIRSLGLEALAEVVWLVGYYSMLQLALAAFDPAVPAAVTGAVTRPL